MQFCKYCNKEMEVVDVERDRNGKIVAYCFVCECGGACYAQQTYSHWNLNWTKEEQ